MSILATIPASPVVHIRRKRVTTNSLDVAEYSVKRHKNVLQATQNIHDEEFNRLNFQPVNYVDAKGEKRPAYEMTKDGFTMPSFGFTGKKAAILPNGSVLTLDHEKTGGTGLTNYHQASMLIPFSQKTKAGISTPNNGHNWPLSTVVFLCPSKTQAALRRLSSVMAGCIGQPLKRLAGSVTGSANLMQSATQRLAPKGGGLSPYNGVTAMRHYVQNPAKSSQAKYISLFNLVKRTPEGRRVICRNLTFSQASALVAEIPNAVVKFSRMEASQ